MTGTEAKALFNLKFDSYSAYFNDARLSSIFNDALDRVIEHKIGVYESDIKVLEELSPLVVYPAAGAPVNTAYDDKPADWKQGLSIYLKYTGQTEARQATLKRENDGNDPYESPTQSYPKYKIRDKIYYYPTGASQITKVYIKNYTPVDLVSSPGANLPFTNKKILGDVIDEAVKIAAAITREEGMYQIQDKEVKENP